MWYLSEPNGLNSHGGGGEGRSIAGNGAGGESRNEDMRRRITPTQTKARSVQNKMAIRVCWVSFLVWKWARVGRRVGLFDAYTRCSGLPLAAGSFPLLLTCRNNDWTNFDCGTSRAAEYEFYTGRMLNSALIAMEIFGRDFTRVLIVFRDVYARGILAVSNIFRITKKYMWYMYL